MERKLKFSFFAFMISVLFLISFASAFVCNSSFLAEKRINISTDYNISYNDYSVLLNVSYVSGMNPDFKDIRFVNSSGSQLGYWFYNNTYYPSSSALIYVKLDQNLSNENNVSIYICYKNTSAMSWDSDISRAFLFADDFNGNSINWQNDSAGWKSTNSYLYNVTGDGLLNITFTGLVGNDLINSAFNYSDYIAETRIFVPNISGSNCRFGNSPSENDWADGNDEIDFLGFGDYHIALYVGGSFNQYNDIPLNWILFNNRNPLYSLIANSTAYYDDGSFIGDMSNTHSYQEVYVYFWSYSAGYCYVDWVYLKRYIPDNPTYVFGMEENATTPDSFPSISSNNPLNYYNSTNGTIVFNCSATDDNGILNLTLTIDGVNNYTITNLTANQNLSLQTTINFNSNQQHTWNCSATDSSSQVNSSELRIFTIDIPHFPTAVLINPSSYQNFTTNIGSFNCSASNSIGIINLSLIFKGLTNYTIFNTTANENLTLGLDYNLTDGDYNWTCIAFNEQGNSGTQATRFFNINTTIPPSPIVETSLIEQLLISSGAGLGLFILFLAQGLPTLLIGLALVSIIIAVIWGLKKSFKA